MLNFQIFCDLLCGPNFGGHLKLDKTTASKILLKLEWLSANFDVIKPIPLKGEFSNLFKLRLGNYRIIYDVDYENFIITVHYIGHKKIFIAKSKYSFTMQ